MRKLVIGGILIVALLAGGSNRAGSACGADCDDQYQSDVDDCHTQFGDDPADAEDLAQCIQNARDDYQSCTQDCGNQAD